ncbi:hypothetical protein L218DRAFT_876055 [Marasmius fiardii PR-910]|nr:hypothetical protein L218DRAFT_876055 [Marasmius fiardii PR-910]
MSPTPTTSQLTVSLEDHLVQTLQTLIPVLSPAQRTELEPYINQSTSPAKPNRPSSIPYTLLQSISQWTRSKTGVRNLQSAAPKLNPNDYSMIALLAGATTSPGSNFPPIQPPKDAEEIGRQKKRERKAIGAIVNAVFSVVGTGGACWWGSKNTGWKNEWRVLFAFLAAMTVALAEIVLYILWQQRQNTPSRQQKRYVHIKHEVPEVDPSGVDVSSEPLMKEELTWNGHLRLRKAKSARDE